MINRGIQDIEYERQIDALIPKAMKEAHQKRAALGQTYERRASHGSAQGKYNHCFLTQFFHEAMNRLAREAGLRAF